MNQQLPSNFEHLPLEKQLVILQALARQEWLEDFRNEIIDSPSISQNQEPGQFRNLSDWMTQLSLKLCAGLLCAFAASSIAFLFFGVVYIGAYTVNEIRLMFSPD